MASIVDNYGGRALQLGNEEFVRSMQWGNNWNSLRFGISFFINGTANITAPRLLIGLCDGNQNTFSSPNCVQYAGVSFTNHGTLMSYSGGGGYYSAGSFLVGTTYATTKVGSTVTDAGSVGAVSQYANASSGGRISNFFVDFIRVSSTSIQVRQNYVDVSEVQDDVTFYSYMRFLEGEATSTTEGVTQMSNLRTLSGMASTNLDTASIYWNKSTPTIEINDICLVRFY